MVNAFHLIEKTRNAAHTMLAVDIGFKLQRIHVKLEIVTSVKHLFGSLG